MDEQVVLKSVIKAKCCGSFVKLLALAFIMILAAIVVVVYFIVAATTPGSSSTSSGIHFPESSSPLGRYRFAAVAADAGRCSQIGTAIIAKGGSAVDGIIAATLCAGVFNMHNTGIGGGFFMTIWSQSEQKAYVVDARETAPLSATENMFESNDSISSVLGPFAIAVPGEIAGYWAAHQRFGKLPWNWLFEPTIKLCKDGFPVSKALSDAIRSTLQDIAKIKNQEPFQNLIRFLKNPKTMKPYTLGETIYCNSKLIDTLSRIAEFGGDDFYNGSLAADILADLQEFGAPINKTDISTYRPVWRKPIDTIFQSRFRLISPPPPGSGAILSFILNILSGYNLTESSSQDTLSYHRFIEALKFGYAKRTHLGDTDFVTGLDELIANLTSPAYGDYVRSLIDDSKTKPISFYDTDARSAPGEHGTCHISVLDPLGNAASVTSTINTYFGSGILGSRTGIIFNSEMDDFSSPNKTNSFNLPPSPNNFIRPGKRPQSSTCPSVVLVEDPNDPSKHTVSLIVGGSGGSRITSTVAYVITRVLWFKETVKQAVDAQRLHHQYLPDTIYYDRGMPRVVIDALYKKGHVNQTQAPEIMSCSQAIQRSQNGTIYANSDYRKTAFCDGF